MAFEQRFEGCKVVKNTWLHSIPDKMSSKYKGPEICVPDIIKEKKASVTQQRGRDGVGD